MLDQWSVLFWANWVEWNYSLSLLGCPSQHSGGKARRSPTPSLFDWHVRLCLQGVGGGAHRRQPRLHSAALHIHRSAGQSAHGAGPILLHHHGDHLVHQLWVGWAELSLAGPGQTEAAVFQAPCQIQSQTVSLVPPAFGAVLQGSLFGLVGLLPQKYSTIFMSGQGLAGTFAAIAMLLAIGSKSPPYAKLPSDCRAAPHNRTCLPKQLQSLRCMYLSFIIIYT